MDEYDIDLQITHLEIEYERTLNASFGAKERLRRLASEPGADLPRLARARALCESLERKRRQLQQALDDLELRGPSTAEQQKPGDTVRS